MKHGVVHHLLVVVFVLLKSLFGSVLWILIGLAGYFIFQSQKSPYNVVIGLPLFLIGAGFIINSLSSLFLSIFSPVYNRGICFICKKS